MRGLPAPAPFAGENIEVLSLPLWAWQIALSVTAVVVLLVLLVLSLLRPTTGALRWWGLGNIVVNVGIAVTGATVRVTSSGLGCSEWPRCTEESFVPVNTGHTAINAAIEFGNRTLTFLVLAVGVFAFIATLCLRRRRDLVTYATIIPLGVLGQGVVGGITVWSGLHPASVAAHFLLSMLVVVVAVAYYVRCREPRGRLRPTVSRPVRLLATAMVPLGFVLLVAGTVVTGTGPHGGDAEAPRWSFDMVTVARVHSSLAWAVVLGSVTLAAAATFRHAPAALRTAAWLLLAAVLAQGAVGYTQYLLGLPEWLVVLHVLGSGLVWVAILRVYFATAERVAPTSPAAAPAGAGTAVAAAGRAAARE